MNIKDIVKDNTVTFSHFRDGNFYYTIPVSNDAAIDDTSHSTQQTTQFAIASTVYQFPVPLDDIAGATLLKEDKAMLFRRFIRKALDAGTFVIAAP
jgi:hypothetical protein